MEYYIFELNFKTPVHFGNAGMGGNLEKKSLCCPADTFFSALCNEAALIDAEYVEKLYDASTEGKFLLSSLFPYISAATGEKEFYLPKPLLVNKGKEKKILNFSEMKVDATKMKALKKTEYIRVSKMKEFLLSLGGTGEFSETCPDFAIPSEQIRVNMRGEKLRPYLVGSYTFRKDAGLYFVAGFAEAGDVERFCELVRSLGYTGIGGKRSSGYGKFELDDDPIIISEYDWIYEDDKELAKMLGNTKSAWQMCIAPLLPDCRSVQSVKSGSYKLIVRGGFISSSSLPVNIKRNKLYMLAEGSCFKERISGCVDVCSIEGLGHPLYRNGKGMFVGLDYE